MFLQRLWTAQWEDTINFHAKLFRCFLLGFLDAHGELVFVSQGSERLLAVLGRRLADVGLRGLVSHPVSPFGPHNDAKTRCPPKRRYEAIPLPSFAATTPMDWLMSVPPTFSPQSINVTHGLYDELTHSALTYLPGSNRALLAPFAGMVGYILLWLLALAIIFWRSSGSTRTRSTSTQTMCRPPAVALDTSTNSIRPLPQDHPSIENETQNIVTGIAEDVDHCASMPGAWFHECRKRHIFETLPEPVSDMVPWRRVYFGTQKAWARFSGTTSIVAASGPWDHTSNDMVISKRTFEDGGSSVRQGPGSDQVDLGTGFPTSTVFSGTEVDGLPAESSLSVGNSCGSSAEMCGRQEPSTVGDVAIKDLESAQAVILDAAREDKIGLTFALVASSNVNRVLCEEGESLDSDESASEDRTDGTGGEASYGIGIQHPGIVPLERKDEYRALGRRQDGAFSNTQCPLSLRRAHSTGTGCDIFDDSDEVAGDDDSYWTEQVNARLSGTRPCRYGWSDVSSWPREGREDETDNWRARNSHVTHFAAPEKARDARAKLRRFSSPPLNVNASLSDRVGSDDGPPGIYVVPQKRGRAASGRSWSPVSSPRSSDRPSGLGFFPFRKAPPLLTPEAWRPGCLYIPDPPADESGQADAWWDSLNSVGGCGVGHMLDGGTVHADVHEQEPRDPQGQGAQVSWRDRYENDPASRRFHRRAMTGG